MLISEVPDHPGYFVDSKGIVYSQWVNRGQHGTVRGGLLRPLSASKHKHGHLSVSFGRNSEKQYIHRLVYRIFKGEIPEGLSVCHKDGDPSNNELSNLYAGTQKENMRDMVRHGKASLAKLTEEQAREILSLRKQMMVKDIAYKFNVRRQTVTDICQGRTWSHLTRKVAE